MSQQFTIRPEPAKALSAAAECKLLREAFSQNPYSAPLRLKLAKLLNLTDAFGETIGLLTETAVDSLTTEELLELTRALLARGRGQDEQLALETGERSAELAHCDIGRSVALAEAAKACFRLNQPDRAEAMLRSALELDPANAVAFKRLTIYWLRGDRTGEVLDLIGSTERRGVRHSRLLSSKITALAKGGRVEEASRLLNLVEFVHRQQLLPPPEWASLQAFNDALATELCAHPGLRFGRHGTASHSTWRVDSPMASGASAIKALIGQIASAASEHAAGFLELDHPWLTMRPERMNLASWSVMTGPEGYEDWHTHPNGWMSGTYYVEVPESVSQGESEAGCLAIGLPEGLVGDEAARSVGRLLVRPMPGMLVLFPSHGYHRTFPHGCDGRRICISFDLEPA